MTKHYNKKEQTPLRRMLRKNLSKAEAVMRKHLSRKQMCGCKFRRQHGFDRYVVDFYCPELKLAIEIDSESHFQSGAVEYDREREKYIKAFGVRMLRFQNSDVYQNLNGVLEEIHEEIERIVKKQTVRTCQPTDSAESARTESINVI